MNVVFVCTGNICRSPIAEKILAAEVEAAGLARTAAGAVTPDGRPLAAGHLDVPWPTEPHLVLWHALSILREHRGDGHIALLVEAGLTASKGEARRTLQGGGVRVGDDRVEDIDRTVTRADAVDGAVMVLRKGKKSVALVPLI